MQGVKHRKAHSYNYKIDYTLHEPRYAKRPKKTRKSPTTSLKFRTRSPSPVKNSSFMTPSLPIIKETAHLPHSRVQLDKLFRMLNERPSSRYDTRDTEMEYLLQEVDSVISRCYTSAGSHRKPKRPIALPSLPLHKFLGRAATSCSRIHSSRDPRVQYNTKTPPTKQKSSRAIHRSEPKHARSSSSITGSSTKLHYKRARKANSISFMRDGGYIQELEKISNIKDIPAHMQSSYLSNASLYKSIIMSRSISIRSKTETPNESKSETPRIVTPNRSFNKSSGQVLPGDKVALTRIVSLLKKMREKERRDS